MSMGGMSCCGVLFMRRIRFEPSVHAIVCTLDFLNSSRKLESCTPPDFVPLSSVVLKGQRGTCNRRKVCAPTQAHI